MNAPISHTSHASGAQKLMAHLAMIAFAALVAGSFSFGAIAAPHLGPAALNAVRFVLGTSIMGGVALVMLRGRIPAPRGGWRYLVLGALMAIFFITMFIGLRIASPVSMGAVFTLMPLMAAIFGWLILGQVPRIVVVASLLLAACGALWVIFGGNLDALMAFDVGAGEAIFVGGVACHALYAVLVRRFNRGEPVVAFTFWTLGATGLCIALWGAGEIVATDWLSVPLVVWGAIFYLAIFTTAGTFFLLQYAALRLPASKVVAYNYLTPSFVIVYEGLLGHGWTSASVVAGAAVTVAGLVLLALAPD
ncbi:MAG: DMT family transporter [Mesorhizobium sp.]